MISRLWKSVMYKVWRSPHNRAVIEFEFIGRFISKHINFPERIGKFRIDAEDSEKVRTDHFRFGQRLESASSIGKPSVDYPTHSSVLNLVHRPTLFENRIGVFVAEGWNQSF